MKVLVLGGTGVMGVELVRILGERGEEIIVTSRSDRESKPSNVKYIKGDAHDTAFLQLLLTNNKYDAIVDFMVYNTEEFKAKRDLFLCATNQYIFLSSSRVYADSKTSITEESPRLLDVTTDSEYLKTDEYALTKARQENLLRESGKTNWTIIRPYITYSNQRLQLGVYEKELWLYRALHDKIIVFPTAIAEKYTTMTLGADVAIGIAKLIGNEKAMGQAFHITTDKPIKWYDVLMTYKKVFKDMTGKEIIIKYTDNPKPIYNAQNNRYQVIYDRLFDRKFDNAKFLQAIGECAFELPEIGLEKCLRGFLENPKFGGTPNLTMMAMMDKLSGERTKLSEISGLMGKLKYSLIRYFPDEAIQLLKKIPYTTLLSSRKTV